MNRKQKDDLLKVYFDIADKYFYSKSIDDFVAEQEKRYKKYFKGEPVEKQAEMWLKLLGSDRARMLYLGAMLSLKEDDMQYLNDALYSATSLMQLTSASSGYDHSIYAWNLLPLLLSANCFNDIKLIFPKENGLSKNGMGALKAITNLVMYLYYGEDGWKEKAVNGGARVLNSKESAECKAVVACLLSLVEKDFDKFSAELSNVCKGKKQSKLSGENAFTKQFAFFALGLFNFARFLYAEETDKITLPDDDNFPAELCEYQKTTGYRAGKMLITFKPPLTLLNDILNIELPPMYLRFDNKTGYTDVARYRSEVLAKVLKK